MAGPLLSRQQILAHRHTVMGLGRKESLRPQALATAAAAGLTDSMPRAAVTSLHARVDRTPVDVLDDPMLTQVWGPRFSTYVVTESDAPVFTVGRHPDSPSGRGRAERMAALLGTASADELATGEGLGVHPNALRYATTTGMVRIVWDGARRPTIRLVARPEIEPDAARKELLRRYLRVMGPGTPDGFSAWAGLKPAAARTAFDALQTELVEVETPVGPGWILEADEAGFRSPPDPEPSVRLLPSGDTWYLCWGRDRDIVVPDAAHQAQLWTPRVWPGAVLVGTEVVGTWRRSKRAVVVEAWQDLGEDVRDDIEAEAAGLPLPDPGEGSVTFA